MWLHAARVANVAEDRMPELGEMHPDLIASARLELHLDERRVAHAFDDAKVRDGPLTAAFAAPHGPAIEVLGRDHARLDRAVVTTHDAVDDRLVDAFVRRPLRLENAFDPK